MQRTIVLTLVAVCLIGLTSAGLRLLNKDPLPRITARDQDTDSLVADQTLFAQRDYDLFVADRGKVSPDDRLTWHIQRLDPTGPTEKDLELNEPVREWKFKDTGTYEVRAFLNLREVGHSIFHVIDGDRFTVDWGSELEQPLGSSFLFTDRSTNAIARKWVVNRTISEEEVTTGTDARFDWSPEDTGTYSVRLRVESASGKVERDERTVTVAPVPAAPVEAPKPVPKPVWTPKPPQPEPRRAAAAGSTDCFVMKRLEGSNFLVEVGKPDAGTLTFSAEATNFTVSPIHDCIFTGFDYYGDSKIQNIEILIECLSKTCTGTPIWTKRIKGIHDAQRGVSANFTSPVLNKDYQYMVTVKPLAPGKLGYFQTNGNTFTSEKQGSAFRSKDVTLKVHDVKTCVFHLRFTR